MTAADAVFPDDAVRADTPLLAALLQDGLTLVDTPAPLCDLLQQQVRTHVGLNVAWRCLQIARCPL